MTQAIQRHLAAVFAKTVAEVHGLEHLPQEGSFLFATNHIDFLDGFFINAALARASRRIRLRYITKTRNYWWLPGFTFPISNRNGVIVPRAARALTDGDVVVNFPEGERNTTDTLKPGKRGTARLALMSGVPIVPCGLIGPGGNSLRESLETYFWRGIQMKVMIGRPIMVKKEEHVTNEHIDALTHDVMKAIAHLAKKHPPVLR